jgi:hypothetical protein
MWAGDEGKGLGCRAGSIATLGPASTATRYSAAARIAGLFLAERCAGEPWPASVLRALEPTPAPWRSALIPTGAVGRRSENVVPTHPPGSDVLAGTEIRARRMDHVRGTRQPAMHAPCHAAGCPECPRGALSPPWPWVPCGVPMFALGRVGAAPCCARMPARGSLGRLCRTVRICAEAGVGSSGHQADAGAVAIRASPHVITPTRGHL